MYNFYHVYFFTSIPLFHKKVMWAFGLVIFPHGSMVIVKAEVNCDFNFSYSLEVSTYNKFFKFYPRFISHPPFCPVTLTEYVMQWAPTWESSLRLVLGMKKFMWHPCIPLSGILPETLSLSPFLAFSLHVSLSRFLSLVIALQAPWLVYQVLLSVPVPIDEQEARKRENKNPSLEVIDTRG